MFGCATLSSVSSVLTEWLQTACHRVIVMVYCHFTLCVCVSVVPAVLVANKADLEIGRQVTTDEGQRLAKDLRFECSCFHMCMVILYNAFLVFVILDNKITLSLIKNNVSPVKLGCNRNLILLYTTSWQIPAEAVLACPSLLSICKPLCNPSAPFYAVSDLIHAKFAVTDSCCALSWSFCCYSLLLHV